MRNSLNEQLDMPTERLAMILSSGALTIESPKQNPITAKEIRWLVGNLENEVMFYELNGVLKIVVGTESNTPSLSSLGVKQKEPRVHAHTHPRGTKNHLPSQLTY